jgi:hypothetical protein
MFHVGSNVRVSGVEDNKEFGMSLSLFAKIPPTPMLLLILSTPHQ